MKELDMVAELLAKPGPSAATVEAGRRRLRQEAASRRPRRGLVFGGLGGLTALVAGGAAAAVLLAGSPETVTGEQNATTVLLSAAERAEASPVGSGRYWYVNFSSLMGRSRESLDIGGYAETWTTTDGQKWYKQDHRLIKEKSHGKFVFCDKELTYQQLQSLPSEPDALRADVRQIMLHNDDGPVPADAQAQFLTSCMISLISGTPAPPKVRAAAFRSLATLPETRKLGVRKDSAGRAGTALLIVNGRVRDTLIIDTGTATVLETERVETRGPQTMVQVRTLYKVGWTDVPPS